MFHVLWLQLVKVLLTNSIFIRQTHCRVGGHFIAPCTAHTIGDERGRMGMPLACSHKAKYVAFLHIFPASSTLKLFNA